MSVEVGAGTVEQAEQELLVKGLSPAFEPIFLEICAFSLLQVSLAVAVPICPEVSVFVVMGVQVLSAVLFDRGHHPLWVLVPA